MDSRINGSAADGDLKNGVHEESMDDEEDGRPNCDVVAILDCGAQYGKVIDRRLRELKVDTRMLPLSTPVERLIGKYKAVVISGSPYSTYDESALNYDRRLFRSGLPILGICYGLHVINTEFGGTVEAKPIREDGQLNVTVDPTCALFKGLETNQLVLMTHGDSVDTVATGFTVVARSGSLVAGIANAQLRIYGVQFHPEIDLTVKGKTMLQNFLYTVAGCQPSFTIESRMQTCIDQIQKVVGDKKVLVLCSGGVDSSVCAALLTRALGKARVIAVFIDNGFMRKNEAAMVRKLLSAADIDVKSYDKSCQFYYATPNYPDRIFAIFENYMLNRTTDPEMKRRIIGDTFMRVVKQIMTELDLKFGDILLAQGTLRPDLIESASKLASGQANVIKTHHNDTEMVRQLRARGLVIEPLKDFHKDEVRSLGRDLGLPEATLQRHPFPGPGLAVRVICATEAFIPVQFHDTQNLVRKLVAIGVEQTQDPILLNHLQMVLSNDELYKLFNLDEDLFATLLPIQTVGVQGDRRTYSFAVALSSFSSRIPWDKLFFLAKTITKILHNVNRVVYVFGDPVQGNITEVTQTLLTSSVLHTAREADSIVQEVMQRENLLSSVSQMPVVLLPLHFDRPENTHNASVKWSICLRPVVTSDFMTCIPAHPGQHISEKALLMMNDEILNKVPMISRVLFDLTSKPPATIEWE